MTTNPLDFSSYPKKHQVCLDLELNLASKFVSGSKSVLDMGCGTGRAVGALAPNVGEYVGVDINKKYLNEAVGKSKKYKNVSFKVADAKQLSNIFDKRQFTKAVSLWNTIACVDDDVRCLNELCKVVSEGVFFTVNQKGALKTREAYYKAMRIDYTKDEETESIYSDAWGESRAYSKEELKDLVGSSGMKLSKIIVIKDLLYAVYLQN